MMCNSKSVLGFQVQAQLNLKEKTLILQGNKGRDDCLFFRGGKTDFNEEKKETLNKRPTTILV